MTDCNLAQKLQLNWMLLSRPAGYFETDILPTRQQTVHCITNWTRL